MTYLRFAFLGASIAARWHPRAANNSGSARVAFDPTTPRRPCSQTRNICASRQKLPGRTPARLAMRKSGLLILLIWQFALDISRRLGRRYIISDWGSSCFCHRRPDDTDRLRLSHFGHRPCTSITQRCGEKDRIEASLSRPATTFASGTTRQLRQSVQRRVIEGSLGAMI